MYCIACSTGHTWRNTAWVFFIWTLISDPTSVDSTPIPKGAFMQDLMKAIEGVFQKTRIYMRINCG